MNRSPLFATMLLLSGLAACSDDAGGGGGSGGAGTGGATSATTTATTAATTSATTAATTTSTTSTTSGDGGAGGGGVGGAQNFGGSPDLACPDVDLDEEDLGTGADPEAGDFTLEEALDGLPAGDGPLRVIIDTDLGDLTCELFPEVAPIGVANFVGLARGRRPFLDPTTDHWIRGRRFYDGLTFHRVIDDFVAQGGDPLGNGFGGPGYAFVNETDGGESHTPGTLAYANAGPDTNGSQFYVVAEEPAAFLDGDYTIFGRCEPVAVAKAITEVATDANDAPLAPIVMNRVHVTRCDAP